MTSPDSNSFVRDKGWAAVSKWVGYDRIHEFNGGLGNQMFQYALAFGLQQRFPTKVAADTRRYGPHADHNGWEICQVFKMPDRFPELTPWQGKVTYRLAKFLGKVTREADDLSFREDILSRAGHGYVRGYWPSFKYSRDAEATLRRNFTFANHFTGSDILADKLKHPSAVGVHVRRGDYLKATNVQHFGGVCTPAYYDAAIKLTQALIPEARFFIFSDDLIWCRQHFIGSEFTFIEGNSGQYAWRDMALFAQCSHHIIANSSFSWWGMWLADRKGRSVRIGPSRLLNPGRFTQPVSDFFDDDVVKINEQGEILPITVVKP